MAKAELKKKNIGLVIPATKEEREKALKNAIAQIEKQYGAGAIMRLGAFGSFFCIVRACTGDVCERMRMSSVM